MNKKYCIKATAPNTKNVRGFSFVFILQRDNLWKRGTLTKLYKSKEFPQSFEKIRFSMVFPLLCGQKYVFVPFASSLLPPPTAVSCSALSNTLFPFSLLLHFVKQGNFDFSEGIDLKETSLTYLIAGL